MIVGTSFKVVRIGIDLAWVNLEKSEVKELTEARFTTTIGCGALLIYAAWWYLIVLRVIFILVPVSPQCIVIVAVFLYLWRKLKVSILVVTLPPVVIVFLKYR
jgi:hypothetical protein